MTYNPQSEDQPGESEHQRKSVDELLRRVDALPALDSRTADEILGYDESGIPK